MLFLLLVCVCSVYLWHHAPVLLLFLGGMGVLWYVVIPLIIAAFVAITLVLLWGVIWGYDLCHWLANALPEIPGLTRPFSWERRWTARIPTAAWTALGLGAFVLLTVLAHACLPR